MPSTLTLASSRWPDWIQTLLELRYSEFQIDSGLDYLAVFRDEAKRQPLALITRAREPEADHVATAEDDGFQLLVTGAVDDHSVWGLGQFLDHPEQVSGLPTWMPRVRRTTLVPRTSTLLPFRAEEDLREAFRACHDAIYKALANDPAASFDLVMLTIAAKAFDERDGTGDVYEFGVIEGEPPERSAARLAKLLAQGRAWLDGHQAGGNVPTDWPAALAVRLLSIFQNYSLSITAASISGTDVLGTAYESIVGSTFRGELGSYFTPRTVADFMARLLDIRHGRVLDPACGSGGLLLAVRRARPEDPIDYFGNDLNPRMVRAARVNFLLHGLNPRNILRGNGLELDRIFSETIDADVPEGSTWHEAIPDGQFTAVLANPPFAGHENDPGLLRRIVTARRNGNGDLRNLNRTLPFIETIIASLEIGGVAGLVLPTSILNAEEESFVRIREFLLETTEIVAIIGLPERAFVHTDCGVHGLLLFIRRVEQPRDDYELFVDWARYLGYDRLGRYRRENDFPAILERYRSSPWPAPNTFSVRVLTESGRWDPAWLGVYRSLPRDDDGADYVALTDLLSVRNARFSRRTIQDDDLYRFFEVADADIDTGRIVRVQEATGFELKKKGRIKNRVCAGDVLLPNHRDSLIAKGSPTGRSAVVVEEQFDGLLTTDRFLVLTPHVQPDVLVTLLNSAGVRRQIVAQCRGAASLDIREKTLAQVLVPRTLLSADNTERLSELAQRDQELREALDENQRTMRTLVEVAFGSEEDFRPAGWAQL